MSLDPPLVLACVERRAHTHDCIRSAGFFAISMLRQDQERLARRFAAGDPAEKYEGIAFREERTGAPIIENALAWLDCRIWQAYPAGDHTLFVGEVLAADAGEGEPLIYYRGGYGRITP